MSRSLGTMRDSRMVFAWLSLPPLALIATKDPVWIIARRSLAGSRRSKVGVVLCFDARAASDA